MGKVTTVTCDFCHKDISQSNYQTVSIRRYTGYKHEKKISYPALWLCDDCYRKLSMYMMLPMEKEEEYAVDPR